MAYANSAMPQNSPHGHTFNNSPVSTNDIELIVIDDRVENKSDIIESFKTASTASKIEIINLSSTIDGVAQLSENFRTTQNTYRAIHVVSHGKPGELVLGSSALNQQEVEAQRLALHGWRDALTADADIYIYACEVAGNAQGKKLIESISSITGADVAASNDLTGSTAKGGDWQLEVRVGTINNPPLTAELWHGVLADKDGDLIDDALDLDDDNDGILDSAENTETFTLGGNGILITSRTFNTDGTVIIPPTAPSITTTGDNLYQNFDQGTFGTESLPPDDGDPLTTEMQSPAVNPYPGLIFDQNNNNLDAAYRQYTPGTAVFGNPTFGQFSFVANVDAAGIRNPFQAFPATDPVYGREGRMFTADPDAAAVPSMSDIVTNLESGRYYEYAFWAANTENGLPNRIGVEIGQPGGTLTQVMDTGGLPRANSGITNEGVAGVASGVVWTRFSFIFLAPVSGQLQITLASIGNAPGGNDIYIDNLELRIVAEDTDGDGIPDQCDLDSDNDGISDLLESGADASVVDTDNDGLYDNTVGAGALVNAQGVATAANGGAGVTPANTDVDGIANFRDLDSDGDGIPDTIEAFPTIGYTTNDGNVSNDDSDGDGVIDAFDSTAGHGADFDSPSNSEGIGNPDFLDTDSDNDGQIDSAESGLALGGNDFDMDGIDDSIGASYTDPNGSIDDPSATLTDTISGNDVDYRELPIPTVTSLFTMDTTPTLTGTHDSDTVIMVTVNSTTYTEGDGNLIDNGNGTWTLNIPTVTPDGTFSVTAVSTVGPLSSTDTTSDELIIDATAPDVTGDNVGPTSDTTPTLTGTTDEPPGSTITVTNSGGATVCTATVVAGTPNTWTCTPTNPLPEGMNSLTVSITDAAGNTATDSLIATIDTLAPSITGDNVGPTNDTTPDLTGTTDEPAGSTVTVTNAGGATVCTATVVAGTPNSWTCTPVSALPEGTNPLTATITDAAGNSASDPLNAIIDITLPLITGDDVGPTSDTTPDLVGTTDEPAGSTVTVTDGGGATICTATVVAGTPNNWTCVPATALPEGTNPLTASITDAAGNTATDALNAIIDSVLPTIVGDDVGPTNDTTPALTGTTDEPAGSTVTVTNAGGATICTATVVTGTPNSWTCTPASALPEGTNPLTASITDGAGNTATDPLNAIIDTTAPSVTGNNVGPSSDTTPNLTGTTDEPAGSTVTVTDAGGATVCTATVVAGIPNSWTCVPTGPLSEGINTLTASITDAAGNTATDPFNVVIDSVPPTIVGNDVGPTNDTTPALNGTTDELAGSTVTVTDAGGATICTAIAVAGTPNSWTCTPATPLPEGTNPLTASVTDIAGNTATDSLNAIIDTTLPVITGDDVGPTNDTTPALTGTTDEPAGSTVTVTDAGGATLCTATVVTGTPNSWTCTPATPLPEGTNPLTATITDAAGNTATDPLNAIIDSAVPVIVGNDVGPTNDTTPDLSGTTDEPAGSTVTVTDAGGATVCTAIVVAGTPNSWTCTPATPLPEGTNPLTASITDGAGNTATDPLNAIIDTTLPVITGDNVGPTNDTTPDLTGTTDEPAGSTVTVTDSGGATVCTAIVVAGTPNSWTCTPATPLPEGTNALTASITDGAGNTATDALNVIIDTTLPVITGDDVGPTMDTTPDLMGTTNEPAGSTVTVTDAGGATLCTATVVAGTPNSWACTPATPLPEGTNSLTASITDGAGNTATDPLDAIIDTTAPAITGDDVGPTSDTTPDLTGTTDEPAGSTVTVTDAGGATVCTATVVAGTPNSWTCTPATALPEGTNPLTATITDAAGNTASDPLNAIIDSAVPVIVGDDIGPTNDTTPDLTGTTDEPAGSTVTVTDAGGATVCTATVVAGTPNSWTCTPATPLPEGTNPLTASITDGAGNTATDPLNATIDTTAPVITGDDVGPTSDTTPDLVGTTDEPAGSIVTVTNTGGATICTATVVGGTPNTWVCTPATALPAGTNPLTATITDAAGNTASDPLDAIIDTSLPLITGNDVGPTSDTTPDLTGTTDEPVGSTVTITDAGGATVCTATVVAGTPNSWTCTPATPLPEGTNALTASITDGAGNTATDPLNAIIDTTAPVITGDDVGPTSDTTPDLTGTTDEPVGSTVTVTDAGGATVCTAIVVAGTPNSWTCAPATALPAGNNPLTATITDAAGNSASDPLSAIIDTNLPQITGDDVGPTSDTTPDLTGTTDEPAGSTVTVTDAGGATVCTATVVTGTPNSWTCTPATPLPEGTNALTASITDGAGNTATDPLDVIVDTTAPVITGDDVGPTSDTTPDLTGTTDEPAGSTVTVTDAGGATVCTATVVAGTPNSWTCTPASILPEGTNPLTATITDAAGNTATDPLNAIIDSVVPVIVGNDVGPTNDTTPDLSGTTDEPAGSTVTVTDAGGATVCTASVVAGTPNSWTCTPATPLPEGTNPLTASITDGAGNTATDPLNATIDTTAPVITGDDVGPTNNTTPDLTGTTDEPAGSTVTVTDAGGATLCTAVVVAGTPNSWMCTAAVAFAEGTTPLTVSVTDAAGNTATDSFDVIIDTTLPVVTGDDVGPTNDATPDLVGTTDEPAGSTVTVTDAGGGTICTATVVAGTPNSWTCAPTSPLPEGTNPLTASVTDAAGNTATDPLNVTVDITLPLITADDVGPVSDTTPDLNGTTDKPAGSSVTVTDAGGATICTANVVAGTPNSWTCTPTAPLPEGTNPLVANITDDAGNLATDTLNAIIDTTAPLVTGDDVGPTNDTTPDLAGTTDEPPGSTVTVTDAGGATVCTAVVTIGTPNLWSCVPSSPLVEGSTPLTANITDAAGNTASDPFVVLIDLTAPDVTGEDVGPTTDNTPDLMGTTSIDPGSTVEVTDSTGATVCTATVVAGTPDNTWNCTSLIALPDGTNILSVTAIDASGNTAVDNFNAVIDNSVPVITIDPVTTDDVINGLEATADVTISGSSTGANGENVTVLVNGVTYTTVASPIDGNWSITVPVADVQSLNSAETVTADVANAAGTPAEQAVRDITLDGDSDNDGVPDVVEAGPDPLNPIDTDGDSVFDYLDIDSDGDGLLDALEETTDTGIDSDADGVDDAFDVDATGGADINNDGIDDAFILADTDMDFVPDYLDLDSDNDGLPDIVESQTTLGYMAPAVDSDLNGLADNFEVTPGSGEGTTPENTDGLDNPDHLDTDSDNDGISDTNEASIVLSGITGVNGLDSNVENADNHFDANGSIDDTQADNVPDTDGDVATTGDVDWRDTDSDNDGISDSIEAGSDPTNPVDTDADGVPDYQDIDSDGDGVLDVIEGATDTDMDGAPNYLDLDVDNDGVPDNIEAQTTAGYSAPDNMDANANGLDDAYEGSGGEGLTPVNTDGVDTPDYLDTDADNDGIPDTVEAGLSLNGDVGVNGLDSGVETNDDFTDVNGSFGNDQTTNFPDSDSDAAAAGDVDYRELDSDNDGIPDVIEAGTNPLDPVDTDGDGVPDYQDLDSDGDGNSDANEDMNLPPLTGTDTDGDGIDDAIDPDQTGGPDTNGDGIDDRFALDDSDNDGIPDTLDLDSDDDGIPDVLEGVNDTDGDGVPDYLDIDSDNDGITDAIESGVVFTPSNMDSDSDGIDDAIDADLVGTDNNANGIDDAAEPIDTDGDSIPDTLDIDADNDGIVDLIEAQSTPGYVAPGGIDVDADGLDDAYDQDLNPMTTSSLSSAGLSPYNVDGLGEPDYLNLDADSDTFDDLPEAYAGVTPLNNDTDGDGLDDAFDLYDNLSAVNAVVNPGNNGQLAIDYPDTDGDIPLPGGEPDWRDRVDTDRDGIADLFGDLDDDNDGILDTEELALTTDLDGDGIPNQLDLDSDNDGIPDNVEAQTGAGYIAPNVDANGIAIVDVNGVNTAYSGGLTPVDTDAASTDGDGTQTLPDYLDVDADDDGISDSIEAGIELGTLVVGSNGLDNDAEAPGDSPLDVNGLIDTPVTTLPDSDGDAATGGFADYRETDSDNDGIPDTLEAGPDPLNPVDSDGDGIPDYQDPDSDNDGIPDSVEAGTDPVNPVDSDGDMVPDYLDLDSDGDGLPDTQEAAGNFTMPTDSDGDGTPDYADTDSDNDGIPDSVEDMTTPVLSGVDTDMDGIDDVIDVNQTDGTDADGDGIDDALAPSDNDMDGIPNHLDLDSDNDGLIDALEAGMTPAVPADFDMDGTPDYLDVDSDQDGIPDALEDTNSPALTGSDTDGDGIDDAIDVDQTGGTDDNGDGIDDMTAPDDTDGDGAPDYIDPDSDGDGIPDAVEASNVPAISGMDTDGDGIDDAFDVDTTGGMDINADGVDDLAQPADTDMNGVADHLSLDSDSDGIADSTEADIPGIDTDGDDIDDLYDVDATGGVDADGDGVDDAVVPTDTDGDMAPDYLDLDTDNDGVTDVIEAGLIDANGDGLADLGAITTTPLNTDGIDQPDYRDIDSDNDGISDLEDAGLSQLDTNGDGVIDDPTDGDGDGIPDVNDGQPGSFATGDDSDGDGIADPVDLDADNDGIPNAIETNGGDLSIDTDMDGVPDYLDLDSDNDGISDLLESDGVVTDADGDGRIDDMIDANEDGLDDRVDPGFVPSDVDGTGGADFRDLDSDDDGLPDIVEAGVDAALDSNGDNMIDQTPSGDVDFDGLLDVIDPQVDGGVAGEAVVPTDTDGDGQADFRDLDSDNDELLDELEAGDFNNDGIPDNQQRVGVLETAVEGRGQTGWMTLLWLLFAGLARRSRN